MFRLLRPFQSQTAHLPTLEDEIRRQVRELERDATSFHESIGLLRAALALAGESEQFWRDQLHPTVSVQGDSSQEVSGLAQEGWRRERLHSHVLRNLYQQLLDVKRRFLYRWHENLQQRLLELPADRQPPLQALLDNTLQAILAMSVEQMESQHRQKLESFLTDTPAFSAQSSSATPTETQPQPLSRTETPSSEPQATFSKHIAKKSDST